ncbi:MAG: seryl-tRNA synthetase [Holophagaceae bacterium]|nr:seryl-tRNA synthetase [Holophagaceae bacterium]
MLDANLLRNDLDAVAARLLDRGYTLDRARYQELDQRRRAVLQQAEALKAERNRVSDEVGRLKRAKENADHLIAQQREVGDQMKALEAAEREIEAAFKDFLAGIPNPPHASVPAGRDEHANMEIKRWGEVPEIAAPKDHVELGTALGILDLDRAAKLSGARFAVLKGLGAKLERALISLMLDRQTGAGYQEVIPPYLVNADSMYGTGQLPKFEQDLFKVPGEPTTENLHQVGDVLFTYQQTTENTLVLEAIVDFKIIDAMLWNFGTRKTTRLKEFVRECVSIGNSNTEWDETKTYELLFDRFREIEKQGKRPNPLYLIPTAEVPVTNLYRDEILAAESLPLRHCAFTPCFRSEAGSYGKDTKGIIRQHQFHKVELVTFAAADQAEAELERLTADAEAILELLQLPYRRVLLCTGDMGFSSQKTYDLEVWLPSQNTYREISSCSWFGDFQARRANIRAKGKEGKPAFAHTLNGSGLAVGRTWVAVLENYQQPDGSIRVPEALRPYLGLEVIR